MPSMKSGMSDLILLNKEIEAEDVDQHSTSKVVKLRFTRKQYEAFRDACKVLEVISNDVDFPDFVKKALDADIKIPTITRQFIGPILEAPTRIPVKIPRAQSSGEKKETYFTAPIKVTEKCALLYSKVADEMVTRHDIVGEGITCVTDVRVMVGKYFSTHDLKTDDGIIIDDFIRELVPESISNNKDILRRINGKYVIPKGDKKVVASMVNEVAFLAF